MKLDQLSKEELQATAEKAKLNIVSRKGNTNPKTVKAIKRSGMTSQNKGKKLKPFIIEGHRGTGLFEAHNSISSFKRAISMGLDYVELDTWLTADGVVIVIHGVEGKVKMPDNSMRSIESLDSSELPSILLNEKGDSLPTLEQVLLVCRDKIKVNIELKGENLNLPEAVLKVVLQTKMERNVYLSSFFHPFHKVFLAALEKLQITPPILFAFLFSEKKNFPNLDLVPSDSQLNFSFLMAYDHDAIDLICAARERGVKLSAYFGYEYLETETVYSRLIQLGVASIITNQPNTLLNFRKKYFSEKE